MRDIWQDVRFATRVLVKRRWYTLAAVIALSLGIGANTAVFTIVNVVLLQGLPVDGANRIVGLGMQDSRPRNFGVSTQDFDDWRRSTRTITTLSGAFGANLSFSGDDRAPEQYTGVYMSASGFSITDSKPVIGRLYTTDEDRAGAAEDIERVHGYFPRLKERANLPAGQLSGGEQQMLAIGRALIMTVIQSVAVFRRVPESSATVRPTL